jgi:hypothetical protein
VPAVPGSIRVRVAGHPVYPCWGLFSLPPPHLTSPPPLPSPPLLPPDLPSSLLLPPHLPSSPIPPVPLLPSFPLPSSPLPSSPAHAYRSLPLVACFWLKPTNCHIPASVSLPRIPAHVYLTTAKRLLHFAAMTRNP